MSFYPGRQKSTCFSPSNEGGDKYVLPKQLSCNWMLPVTKYLFRVAEQNSKILKTQFQN